MQESIYFEVVKLSSSTKKIECREDKGQGMIGVILFILGFFTGLAFFMNLSMGLYVHKMTYDIFFWILPFGVISLVCLPIGIWIRSTLPE